MLAYSIDPAKPPDDLAEVSRALAAGRRRFLELADEDARSYDSVRAARRARKEKPEDPERNAAVAAALENASQVPLETAQRAVDLASRLVTVGERTKAALRSDLATSLALFRAATEGALANVAVNLEDLKAAGKSTATFESEILRLRPKG